MLRRGEVLIHTLQLNWVGDLSEEAVRNRAMAVLESAASWIATIGDSEKRTAASVRLGEAWITLDREAATAWIQKSALPFESKQKLLKRE